MSEQAQQPTKRTQIRDVIIILLITLVGCIVVLEFGLRRLYQLIPLEVCASDPIVGNYICQPNYVYDKPIEIAYRYKPNLKIEGFWDPANVYLSGAGDETRPTGRSEPFWYVLETDEMGFPNSDPTWQDEYDIVITGDSFTVRSAEQTWIELLQTQTGSDVLTLGAPSWTTLNEVAAVQKWGLDKNPDWVILAFFEGNDLINVQQYLEKQASGLDWREYDYQGYPWHKRILTTHLVRHWLSGSEEEAQEPPRYRYPIEVNTNEGSFETVLKDIHLLPISADYETIRNSAEFAAIGDALLELKAQAEAQGTRFLFLYIPSKEHLYWSRMWDSEDINNVLERTVSVSLTERNLLSWDQQYLSYNFFNEHHGDQMRALEDFSAENGIEFLNLTPILWQKTIELGEHYHFADPHWNQRGNQLVADTIQAYIEANR